jgi:hypothetical protein
MKGVWAIRCPHKDNIGRGRPQRLKPDSKQCTYRSGKPLRHPKSSTTPTFSASCKAVDEEKLAIAALKRCATQNQVQR